MSGLVDDLRKRPARPAGGGVHPPTGAAVALRRARDDDPGLETGEMVVLHLRKERKVGARSAIRSG